ncbi:MAG: hypothetical protein KDK72_06535, partial [Chlamydiia bacterium]|nr:hypothetical protein [Chlamydiia bacterium]
MSIEPTSNPNPIYTVVFRTEQVLTDTNVRNENLELFFHRKGDLIRADAQYFVFPGVTELFQRLSQEPHVRLALFSDRSEPYVTELCQQLIKRTLSSEKEKQISTSVEVCSEKNLKPHQGDSRSYGLKSREHQIDLRDLVDNQKDLDNAVLIETCTPCFSYTAYTTYTTYIAGDQAPNLLVVSPSTTEIFDQLSKRVDRWDSEGYFLVPIRVNQKYTKKFLNTSIRGSISAGKYIKASPLLTGGYKIAFKKRGVQEHGIAYMSEEEHPDLCKSLADLDYSRETVKLEKGLVLKQIHEWIEKHGGECRIQKVCHKVNRIYYVAGVL